MIPMSPNSGKKGQTCFDSFELNMSGEMHILRYVTYRAHDGIK